MSNLNDFNILIKGNNNNSNLLFNSEDSNISETKNKNILPNLSNIDGIIIRKLNDPNNYINRIFLNTMIYNEYLISPCGDQLGGENNKTAKQFVVVNKNNGNIKQIYIDLKNSINENFFMLYATSILNNYIYIHGGYTDFTNLNNLDNVVVRDVAIIKINMKDFLKIEDQGYLTKDIIEIIWKNKEPLKGNKWADQLSTGDVTFYASCILNNNIYFNGFQFTGAKRIKLDTLTNEVNENISNLPTWALKPFKLFNKYSNINFDNKIYIYNNPDNINNNYNTIDMPIQNGYLYSGFQINNNYLLLIWHFTNNIIDKFKFFNLKENNIEINDIYDNKIKSIIKDIVSKFYISRNALDVYPAITGDNPQPNSIISMISYKDNKFILLLTDGHYIELDLTTI